MNHPSPKRNIDENFDMELDRKNLINKVLAIAANYCTEPAKYVTRNKSAFLINFHMSKCRNDKVFVFNHFCFGLLEVVQRLEARLYRTHLHRK